jgi:hypothetical protein
MKAMYSSKSLVVTCQIVGKSYSRKLIEVTTVLMTCHGWCHGLRLVHACHKYILKHDKLHTCGFSLSLYEGKFVPETLYVWKRFPQRVLFKWLYCDLLHHTGQSRYSDVSEQPFLIHLQGWKGGCDVCWNITRIGLKEIELNPCNLHMQFRPSSNLIIHLNRNVALKTVAANTSESCQETYYPLF